jgi:hypothetical protein
MKRRAEDMRGPAPSMDVNAEETPVVRSLVDSNT